MDLKKKAKQLVLLWACVLISMTIQAQVEYYYEDEAVEDDYNYETYGYTLDKAKQEYQNTELQSRSFDEANWEKVVAEIDYTPKKKKEKKKRNNESTEDNSGPAYTPRGSIFDGISSEFVKFFSFTVLILILSYVIYKIVGTKTFVRNKKITDSASNAINIKELEENLHESDLERYLRLATEQEDYKLGIRVYYLMIIKQLSESKLIKWKKEKTNRDYAKEMRRTSFSKPFGKITKLFDYVWYSDVSLNQADYDALEPHFKSFLTQVGKV